MLICMMKAKIHGAVVTGTNLHYEGSIAIDGAWLDEVGIVEGERVQVLNLNNGARFDTYVIRAKEGSREVCLNGPAARLALPGDIVHIIAYCWLTPEEAQGFTPRVLKINE